MKGIECILFDLDGTLIDTIPLIVASFRHTFLHHFNEEKSDEEILKFIGAPLKSAFACMYPGLEEILCDTYREFNLMKHDTHVGIFIGVIQMLEHLREKNVTVGVVTSKSRHTAFRGMKLFGIDRYMSVVIGSDDTEEHKPKPGPILEALNRICLTDTARVAYVGDSSYDILCAKNAGVRSILAGWGYMPREDLMLLNPDIVLERPEDMAKYI